MGLRRGEFAWNSRADEGKDWGLDKSGRKRLIDDMGWHGDEVSLALKGLALDGHVVDGIWAGAVEVLHFSGLTETSHTLAAKKFR